MLGQSRLKTAAWQQFFGENIIAMSENRKFWGRRSWKTGVWTRGMLPQGHGGAPTPGTRHSRGAAPVPGRPRRSAAPPPPPPHASHRRPPARPPPPAGLAAAPPTPPPGMRSAHPRVGCGQHTRQARGKGAHGTHGLRCMGEYGHVPDACHR